LELATPRVILVAPHPDDEVLGAAGLIQAALARDIWVHVVAVTDGEGSHPHSKVSENLDFAGVRARESRVALRRLGWDEPRITRLHLTDGQVAMQRAQLDESLATMVQPGDLCVAPWRRDGHPDHDACGESAIAVSRAVGATAMGYFVWAWHWADPDGSDIPWSHCQRLDMSRRAAARKRWATGAFQSQTNPIGPDVADAPVLPAPILRRFWRNYEVYVDEMAMA
jgi:LmbE family N-acetylglucosaminyl deacetylase